MTDSRADLAELRAVKDRMASFRQQIAASDRPADEVLPQALLELSVALEELNVCEEELSAQADALATAHLAAEMDRLRHRAVFDAMPLASIVTDHVGVVLEANHTAAALLDRPVGRLIGRPLAALVSEADRRRFRVALVLLAKGAPWSCASRFDLRRSAGELVTVTFEVGRLGIGEGRADELVWVIQQTRLAQSEVEPSLSGSSSTGAVQDHIEQLQHALTNRVLIEQAKGMLMEREGLDAPAAFEMLRKLARSSRRRSQDVAVDVLEGRIRPEP